MSNIILHDKLVVRTRLTPPRLPRHTLLRPRLTDRLLEAVDYRLTIVQAGTGYGKSTALAALSGEGVPLIWYHVDSEDADPFVFLLHLLHGFAATLPNFSDAPLAMLEEWERSGGEEVWNRVVDMLGSQLAERPEETILLVLDDAHLLNRETPALRIIDRLIGRSPPNLHLILSTRYPLKLPTLVVWRVRGQVLEIGQEELAFTTGEVIPLFRDLYGYQLTAAQAEALMAQVEGWPIALPLVWRRLQSANGITVGEALEQLAGITGDLFTYLVYEVLAQQPSDVLAFLQTTAILRQLTAELCDGLQQSNDSEQMLRYLLEQGLFVVDLGNGYKRYHHLFRELLQRQLSPVQARQLHEQAAICYQEVGQQEEAIYHLLAAGAYEEAAGKLEQTARKMLQVGRLDRLAGWLGSLPPDVLQKHPPLLINLGDIARLRSRFEEALGWYQEAEARYRMQGDPGGLSQALRGQARVYLDTVNPSEAEQLLQEALRLSDGQEDRESRVRLLELLAENLLNQGRLEQAGRYQREAQELREQEPEEVELSLRVLLRTGRLHEAQKRLEARAAVEREKPVLRPRAHRETHLLLSLVLAFQGEREAAYRYALEGTQRGDTFNAPFITAVGYMRQGHAWLLQKDQEGYQEAIGCFEQAVTISQELGVPRLQVEASWGLCQAHGFRGELALALEIARRGIAIARQAGDEWVEACIRVTMGAAYVLAGTRDAATTWLSQAATAFRACADSYGETVVRLWQCLLWYQTEDETRLERDVEVLLEMVQSHSYDCLFHNRTLMGPPDPRQLVPLLLFARDRGSHSAFASHLLSSLELARLEFHPGYQLRVQTLGPFHLWRGREEVGAQEWSRKKARELFHFLLTHRHMLLDREQITEMLWPELDPEAGQRDFKISYTTLCRILEPERSRNAPSAFILRDGSRYGLRSEADLWLDSACFDLFIAEGDRHYTQDCAAALVSYRQALHLYQGEYLQEYPYAEWASEERERLLTIYLRTAERVAGILVELESWEEVLPVCQAILSRDDCWEQAYRLMMQAYAGLGNRPQALRTYQRCVERLQSELSIEPTALTTHLYQTIC